MRDKYLITAGTNRCGRQLYVNYYEEDSSWSLSVVPMKFGKIRANQIKQFVEKQLEENCPIRYKKNTKLDIILSEF